MKGGGGGGVRAGTVVGGGGGGVTRSSACICSSVARRGNTWKTLFDNSHFNTHAGLSSRRLSLPRLVFLVSQGEFITSLLASSASEESGSNVSSTVSPLSSPCRL